VVLLKARETIETRSNPLEEKYLSDANSIMAISSMHLQLPTDVLSIVELVYQVRHFVGLSSINRPTQNEGEHEVLER